MELSFISELLSPSLILFMMAGVLMGILFGCIPGLNTPMALALALPITFGMEFTAAISTLLAVYCGGLSGGLISAILLRMPGTAAAITTTFDGYPMSQKGESMRALSLGIFASFFGGIFSTVILLILTRSLADFAIGFGSWEYFGVAIFSLSLVSTLIKGSMINGFVSACIGLLLSTVGSSPIDGFARFTLGQYQLNGGISIVVLIIGIYALSEMISSAGRSLKPLEDDDVDLSFGEFVRAFRELRDHLWNMIRSSAIGTIMGILPGLGGNAASMVAYAQARRFSDAPEEFGKGNPSGIVAPECANNAVAGGAMIPMLALGVPGSTPAALIMSGFIIHGVPIGPLLMVERPDVVQMIFGALIIANLMMLLFQSLLLRFFARVILVPKEILLPIMVVFCTVGAYIANNSMFNVFILIILGVVGFLLEKNGFPLAPIIMGYVLGGLIELYYRRSMIYYDNFSNAFLQPSVGSLFLILAVVIPAVMVIRDLPFLRKNNKK